MDDIDGKAKELAMHHIQHDVDNGISERYIQQSRHSSGRGHRHWKDAADGFGGYYDIDESTGLARRKVRSDKILVTEVCGIEGVWIFSLHDVYQECMKGQLTLL